MEYIILENTLPLVFAGSGAEHSGSDIWLQQVRLNRGGVYLVEAASGTGKSSLCSYLIGYRHDYQGRIAFDETDIRTYGIGEWTHIRQHHISHLFQELRLFPELSTWENIQMKNQLTHHTTDSQIRQWLEAFGIADKTDARVGQMSFGQQQRVAMIRALVQPFDFLLLDEPISHLDDENSHRMAEIVMAEVRNQGAAVVVTSIGKHMNLPYDKIFRL